MKKLLSIFLASCLTLTLVGCASGNGDSSTGSEDTTSSGASSSDVIKIGVFEPITGANAGGGELEVKGVQLARKLYPEILGKKVELVIADNKSDKVEAATAAAKLVEQDKVNAIIGSWGSSLSMAAGDIVKNAQIPAVGASCTNPLVTQGNDFYYRVCFLDTFQATVMANYAYNVLGAKKIALLQEVSNDYSVGLTTFFTEEFKKLTGDEDCIVELQKYNTGDTDFSAQLQNIKSKNPDAIFAPGNFTEAAMAIKQGKDLGITAPFLGTDTWETPAFIEVGGAAVEDVIFSTFFDADKPINEESTKFVEAYREEYGEDPAAVSALSYDAYLVILDAIERANSDDPVKIKEEIAKTTSFPGAAGSITLDENGDAIKDAVLKTVKDGKFTYKDLVKAE